MTKKDTIILAVLFNVVVLAGVLATAHQLATPQEETSKEHHALAMVSEEIDVPDKAALADEGGVAFDEIDQLLEDYISEEPVVAPQNSHDSPVVKNTTKSEPKATKGKETGDMFYIVKAGDNPWKIAKKYHLSFEKLLQLNRLDEAKARNLKIGQKLRIRENP